MSTVENQINAACAYAGITQSELARQMGTSPANFNLKIKRNTLKRDDMERIAKILDATYRSVFTFPDGTSI